MWSRHQLLDEVIQTHFSLLDESCRKRGNPFMLVWSNRESWSKHFSLIREKKNLCLSPNPQFVSFKYRISSVGLRVVCIDLLCRGLIGYATTWVIHSDTNSGSSKAFSITNPYYNTNNPIWHIYSDFHTAFVYVQVWIFHHLNAEQNQ